MSPATRLVVGLTGGIGAGKSLAAAHFADLGATVIDADVIAREVVAPGSPALAEVVAAFGDGILDEQGALDRGRLRAVIFEDDDARARLEGILHPAIRRRMRARAAAAGGPYTVLVVPLLLESGAYGFVDRVLVVDAPPERQVERVSARDGCGAEQVRRIIAAQIDRDARLARADDVLVNDGSRGELRSAVERLHRGYLRAAAERALRDAENQ